MCKIVTNLLILILSRLFIAACNNLIVMNTQFQNIFIAAFEESMFHKRRVSTHYLEGGEGADIWYFSLSKVKE